MRLIDADKLLGLFIESGQKHGSEHGCKLGENWLLDYNDIKAVIDNAPTVDTTFREAVAYECGQKSVEERPKGKWIRTGSLGNGNAHYECSNCHYGDEHAESQEVPYCWYCGADMRGEE